MLFPAKEIKRIAQAIGFSACGIAPVAPADEEAAHLKQWLSEGYHAGMKYMENYPEIRRNPTGLVEGAKSIISVAINYYPLEKLSDKVPHIAYYAYGKDYHFVVKEMLSTFCRHFVDKMSTQGVPASELPENRVFTDSAPLFERYWAWKAGIGWIGKNSNLIIPGKGSFFFLGEIVTTLEVDQYDTPQRNRCGTCTRCLEACPTGALESARTLNANKCLSYLTIENRGEIPAKQAEQMGNRLYGCDTCQIVCPWNRFAKPTPIEAFRPSKELLSLRKEDLTHFTREDYNRIFAKSAVKRAKYEGLLRNINHLKE